MAKDERRMVRKSATKFPNLRKKLQKAKILPKRVKKRCWRGAAQARSELPFRQPIEMRQVQVNIGSTSSSSMCL
jgi:hypothetical protein